MFLWNTKCFSYEFIRSISRYYRMSSRKRKVVFTSFLFFFFFCVFIKKPVWGKKEEEKGKKRIIKLCNRIVNIRKILVRKRIWQC